MDSSCALKFQGRYKKIFQKTKLHYPGFITVFLTWSTSLMVCALFVVHLIYDHHLGRSGLDHFYGNAKFNDDNKNNGGYSIVMPTLNREDLLERVLSKWNATFSECHNLKKIYINWVSGDRGLPDFLKHPQNYGFNLEIIFPTFSSIENRFRPPESLETDAVLHLDDDIGLTCEEIELGYEVWNLDKLRLVGFVPRSYDVHYGGQNRTDFYSFVFKEFRIMLTGAAFMSRQLMDIFWDKVPTEILQYVQFKQNCEDLAVNFVLADALNRRPFLIESKIYSYKVHGVSTGQNHLNTRHTCLNYFSKIMGYNPLDFMGVGFKIAPLQMSSHLFPLVPISNINDPLSIADELTYFPGFWNNICEDDGNSWSLLELKLGSFYGELIALTNANYGYINFAIHLSQRLREVSNIPLFIIAEDCQAYRVLSNHIGSDRVLPPLIDREDTSASKFDTPQFGEIVNSRPRYISFFLRRGVPVLWEDCDSFPLADPSQFFVKGVDLTLVDDRPSDAHYTSDNMCTGFMYISANSQCIALMNKWSLIQKATKTKNQIPFNQALSEMRSSLTKVVLPRAIFPSGRDLKYFKSTSKWVHANYLVGYDAKRRFLKFHGANIP